MASVEEVENEAEAEHLGDLIDDKQNDLSMEEEKNEEEDKDEDKLVEPTDPVEPTAPLEELSAE